MEEEKSSNSSAEETVTLNGLESELKEVELIDNKKRLKKIGLNVELLEAFKAVGLLYKEICRDHGRVLWYRDTNDAKKLGITEASPICEPFKRAGSTDDEMVITTAKDEHPEGHYRLSHHTKNSNVKRPLKDGTRRFLLQH
ncbi:hypothetical protein OSTOST_22375, partial [Ostertagia ostertagi]